MTCANSAVGALWKAAKCSCQSLEVYFRQASIDPGRRKIIPIRLSIATSIASVYAIFHGANLLDTVADTVNFPRLVRGGCRQVPTGFTPSQARPLIGMLGRAGNPIRRATHKTSAFWRGDGLN